MTGIRKWRRVLLPVAVTLIIATGCVLRALHLSDVAVRTPDERTYRIFGSRIADDGPGAMAGLFSEYVENKDSWNYPTPTRVGHIFLVAAMMRLTDSTGMAPVVALSCVCSVLSLLLIAHIGLRFFGLVPGLAAVMFLATSSEELTMVRRGWQDAAFGFFGLLALYFAMEIMRSPRRQWPMAGFHAACVMCVLMKQTGLIVYFVAGLYVLIFLWFVERRPRAAITFLITSVCGVCAAGLVTAVLGGGSA